jgi:hypothetical protein
MQVLTFLTSAIAGVLAVMGIFSLISIVAVFERSYSVKWRIVSLLAGSLLIFSAMKMFYWAGHYETCILKLPSKTKWMCENN